MLQTERKIDLLIIIPPSPFRNLMWPPYGAMYIASALIQKGYNPKILNVDTERISSSEIIKQIRQINPKYIGYSGLVATRYKYIKDLSLKVKGAFSDKIQILGGSLSSAAEAVLINTAIDIIVCGEGEATIVELLECLDRNADLSSVNGIYYKRNFRPIFTGRKPLISNRDSIPFPAFDLIDMEKYLSDGFQLIRKFTNKKLDQRIYDKKRKRKFINILTGMGCIGECSFCVRQDAGLRMHSIKYVFDFIEYCMEKFGVGFFSFGDECFAASKARNWEFINEYKRRKLDIVFRILGMRVDTVDREILRAYKEIGCWMIEYGFESGSQKILNIIDKRVTVQDNRNVALWTQESGIISSPQLILAMPGETNETVNQTIDFVKSLNYDNFRQYKATYALPFPGSELYNYAKLSGAILNEEEYLCSLGQIEGTQVLHVNLTDQKDEIVARWKETIIKELDKYYFYRKYGIKNPIIVKCLHLLALIELEIRGGDLWVAIRKKLKLAFYSLFRMRREERIMRRNFIQFKKKEDSNFEDFLKGADYSRLNRDISLKRINQRLASMLKG